MTRARTSQTHPLQIAEVRASPSHGRIGITFCPGKHDSMASTGAWARDLPTDIEAIAHWGAKLVLTLVESAELRALKVTDLGDEVRRRGLDWKHLPIADFSVPGTRFEEQWHTQGKEIRALLREGGDVLVHCKGGLGRAGMIAARLLVELGMPSKEAIRAVRAARPGAIETPAQLALVRRTVAIADTAAPPPMIDTTALRLVGGRMGSNPAGIYEDAQGRRFYVKSLESPLYARNEILAAKLYQLAGAPTLHYVESTQPNEVATEMVHLEKKSVMQLSPRERRLAQQWFGVHAWTANWDAAGYQGDNQGVVDGTVLTLDLGGALSFRAMGNPKGKEFGAQVGELESLRNNPDNPYAVKLFGDMDEAAVQAAIRVVTEIPDARICQVISDYGGSIKLADKMLARKADMTSRLTGTQ
jgi:protein-tyrosine phosphatase